jgi:hypothetical protein
VGFTITPCHNQSPPKKLSCESNNAPYHHRSETSEAIGTEPKIGNTGSELFLPQKISPAIGQNIKLDVSAGFIDFSSNNGGA